MRTLYAISAPLCSEDAYITFHGWADAAWRGASTSPVWMLATMGRPGIARALNIVADVGATLAAWRMLEPKAFAAFVGLWCLPFFSGSCVSGLETHFAACALIVSRVHPAGLAGAAMLRPDTALVALVASGRRWRWAVAGGLLCALGLWWCGSHTIAAKLSVYGIHWLAGWQWFMPEAFGWLALLLIAAAFTRCRYYLAAMVPLVGHWLLGTPGFWWYAVPSLAMLSFLAASRVRTWWGLGLSLALCAVAIPHQQDRLINRVLGERRLWYVGREMQQAGARGTLLIEPAGIIPWLNPDLRVIDEVGLVAPEMADIRRAGPGWYGMAIRRNNPDWIVIRTSQMASLLLGEPMEAFSGSGLMFASAAEQNNLMRDYVPTKKLEIAKTAAGLAFRVNTSSLVVLRRKNPLPDR